MGLTWNSALRLVGKHFKVLFNNPTFQTNRRVNPHLHQNEEDESIRDDELSSKTNETVESSQLLKVAAVSKKFILDDGTEFHALKSVCFQIESGQILGLLGPNGAGKTTLMSVLTGIQKADSG